MEVIRTTARITLSLLPVFLIKNAAMKRKLRMAQESGDTEMIERIQKHMTVKKKKERMLIVHILLFIPVFIFWATILASMERTPLTGR